MEKLSRCSTVIHLDIDLETLKKRIGDSPRGIVGLQNKTFAELFHERASLYKKWASMQIDGNQTPEQIIFIVKNGIK
jgi:shikimate kinase